MGNKREARSLFDDLFERDSSTSGVIALDNRIIRGSAKIETIKKRGRDNKEVIALATTVNDKKIEDTIIELMQSKEIKKIIEFDNLKKNAIEKLEPLFQKYDLVDSNFKSKNRNEEIKKIRKICINREIKQLVANMLPNEFEISPSTFIKRTGIKRIQQRFNEALSVISTSSNKITRSWTDSHIDFSKVEEGEDVSFEKHGVVQAVKGSILPKIKLKYNISKLSKLLSQEEIENLTFYRFVESNLPNKKQLVQSFILVPDREAFVEIVGVGIFGGFSKSRRELRDTFKKTATFNLDFLCRSIIGVPHIRSLSEFTFEELKDVLHASNYSNWTTFKRGVLDSSIQEYNTNENSEIRVSYQLIPNEQNWEKIKIIPKYKTNRMGIDASKSKYDYLAYYIAIQHRYFQANTLTESLQSFIEYVQSQIYKLSDDDEIFGRSIESWKEVALKNFEVETTLVKKIQEDDFFLEENDLVYDEIKMCLMQLTLAKNRVDEDTGEIITGERKKRYIKTSTYKVHDAITSLKYLSELERKKAITKPRISDFIPFSFANLATAKKIEVDSLEQYVRYKDVITQTAYYGKYSYFTFDNQDTLDLFTEYCEKRRFAEFSVEFVKLIESL